ncbi:hypothetical protein NQZ68_013076 [Dissostichus eleginoides]|nr:hypothetical protein NQZ68_013076 [Dissostichus eleginoides]
MYSVSSLESPVQIAVLVWKEKVVKTVVGLLHDCLQVRESQHVTSVTRRVVYHRVNLPSNGTSSYQTPGQGPSCAVLRRTEQAVAAAVATPGNVDWPSVLTSASCDLTRQVHVWSVKPGEQHGKVSVERLVEMSVACSPCELH